MKQRLAQVGLGEYSGEECLTDWQRFCPVSLCLEHVLREV